MEEKQPEMTKAEGNPYALAGWLAITSAALIFPYTILGLLFDASPRRFWALLPFITILLIVQTACSLYAFYRFRDLLNERYQFHDVDMLIMILIWGTVLLTAFLCFSRFVLLLGLPPLAVKIPSLILILAIGIPLSILGIVFSVKLLKLKGTLNGLLKPYAITYIVGCAFFLTVVLAFLGLFAMAAVDVMLGIIFLRGREESMVPEFV